MIALEMHSRNLIEMFRRQKRISLAADFPNVSFDDSISEQFFDFLQPAIGEIKSTTDPQKLREFGRAESRHGITDFVRDSGFRQARRNSPRQALSRHEPRELSRSHGRWRDADRVRWLREGGMMKAGRGTGRGGGGGGVGSGRRSRKEGGGTERRRSS